MVFTNERWFKILCLVSSFSTGQLVAAASNAAELRRRLSEAVVADLLSDHATVAVGGDGAAATSTRPHLRLEPTTEMLCSQLETSIKEPLTPATFGKLERQLQQIHRTAPSSTLSDKLDHRALAIDCQFCSTGTYHRLIFYALHIVDHLEGRALTAIAPSSRLAAEYLTAQQTRLRSSRLDTCLRRAVVESTVHTAVQDLIDNHTPNPTERARFERFFKQTSAGAPSSKLDLACHVAVQELELDHTMALKRIAAAATEGGAAQPVVKRARKVALVATPAAMPSGDSHPKTTTTSL